MPPVALTRPIHVGFRYLIELEFEDSTGAGFDFSGVSGTLRGRYGPEEDDVLFSITDVELNADDVDGFVRAIIPPDTTAELEAGKSVFLTLSGASGTQWNEVLAKGLVRVEAVA